MVRYECDGCGKTKKNGESWILGFAAENIGVTAARREVTISEMWDDIRAREWLAVHFCSDDCRADYMGKIFGEAPATQTGSRTFPTKRIQRIVPGAVVETVIVESHNRVVAPKTAVRRRKAS